MFFCLLLFVFIYRSFVKAVISFLCPPWALNSFHQANTPSQQSVVMTLS